MYRAQRTGTHYSRCKIFQSGWDAIVSSSCVAAPVTRLVNGPRALQRLLRRPVSLMAVALPAALMPTGTMQSEAQSKANRVQAPPLITVALQYDLRDSMMHCACGGLRHAARAMPAAATTMATTTAAVRRAQGSTSIACESACGALPALAGT